MLYLDTSAVRALGGGLASSSRRDLVTSALTVVELVSAASADARHGDGAALSPAVLSDLIAYLETIR
jgi:hypothetical protein